MGNIENQPGWVGRLSRIDAEKRLVDQPVGTYLLREGDETDKKIGFELVRENKTSIQVYLLTVAETQKKIADLLILETDRGWFIYNDDPILKEYPTFPTFDELLSSIHDVAKQPLTRKTMSGGSGG